MDDADDDDEEMLPCEEITDDKSNDVKSARNRASRLTRKMSRSSSCRSSSSSSSSLETPTLSPFSLLTWW